LSLVLTSAAVFVDQSAQILWLTAAWHLRRRAIFARTCRARDDRLSNDRWWPRFCNTLGAIGWSFLSARARPPAWSRLLTWMSVLLWGLFLTITVGPMVRMDAGIVAAGNAIGFRAHEVWFLLVAEQVLRKTRADTAHGRYARWSHPRRGLGAWLCETLANSRLLRACMEPLRVCEFQSDIRDVVYVNYLVDADVLGGLRPRWSRAPAPRARWAMFTIVTYRHGAFGPFFLGRFRRLFASPVQSNWRIYVKDETSGKEGVYFVTNAIATHLHAIGARLMAEGMPMHLLARGEVTRDQDGGMSVVLDPGAGSAPDCNARFVPAMWPRPSRRRGARASRTSARCWRMPCRRSSRCRPSLGRAVRRFKRSSSAFRSRHASRSPGTCRRAPHAPSSATPSSLFSRGQRLLSLRVRNARPRLKRQTGGFGDELMALPRAGRPRWRRAPKTHAL